MKNKLFFIFGFMVFLFLFGCSNDCDHSCPEMRTKEFRVINNEVEVFSKSRTAFFIERVIWEGCKPTSTYAANMIGGGSNWFLDIMCPRNNEIIIKIGYIYPEGSKNPEKFDGTIVITEIRVQ